MSGTINPFAKPALTPRFRSDETRAFDGSQVLPQAWALLVPKQFSNRYLYIGRIPMITVSCAA